MGVVCSLFAPSVPGILSPVCGGIGRVWFSSRSLSPVCVGAFTFFSGVCSGVFILHEAVVGSWAIWLKVVVLVDEVKGAGMRGELESTVDALDSFISHEEESTSRCDMSLQLGEPSLHGGVECLESEWEVA